VTDRQWNGVRALVTGGAGFIGSHLADALVDRGARVVVVDNMASGALENLEGCWDGLESFVAADVADFDSMHTVFDRFRPQVVFHQAASKKVACQDDVFRDLEVNARGTLVLLELALQFGADRFVHASSGSVYGWPVQKQITESHPLAPLTHYGVSKLSGDRYAKMYGAAYDLKTVILRYYHVYGPRQRCADDNGGVVGIFCRRVAQGEPMLVRGRGFQAKTFTWVGDVVQANIGAALRGDAVGREYNVSSGEVACVLNLARRIRELVARKKGVHAVIQCVGDDPKEPQHLSVGNLPATVLVGGKWKLLRHGLERTFDWYWNRYYGKEKVG